MRAQILSIPHGGGPMPVLGGEGHDTLATFLGSLGSTLRRPDAILTVSAHWEEMVPTVTVSPQPSLYFDYYGFPEEAYSLSYDAPAALDLADRSCEALESAGLEVARDHERGFDHGLFIPLLLMYPGASIPCCQLSLVRGLDPGAHLKVGAALESLRDQNILILGSGMSFHNMQAFFHPTGTTRSSSEEFHAWLDTVLCSKEVSTEERLRHLGEWERAPQARYCHPREEHLIPLHVCAAAAGGTTPRRVFYDDVLGVPAAAYLWD